MNEARTRQLSVMEAIEQRRAVRSFKPETVEAEAVRMLLQAAVRAPTALHLEPWAFVIIQDPRLLKQLSDCARAMLPAAPKRTADRHASKPRDLQPGSNPADFNIFYNASTLIVICARPLGELVAADCWLAAENLMLAAESLGLGTCCIGSALGVLNTAQVKSDLSIPPEVQAIAAIIVGIPESVTPPTPRKAPEILAWK